MKPTIDMVVSLFASWGVLKMSDVYQWIGQVIDDQLLEAVSKGGSTGAVMLVIWTGLNSLKTSHQDAMLGIKESMNRHTDAIERLSEAITAERIHRAENKQ